MTQQISEQTGEQAGEQSGELDVVERHRTKMRPMSRPGVLRRLVALYRDARYLEVGVCTGSTFDRVPAARKVAVDPAFRFDHEQKQRENPGTEYHPVTSDHYFATIIGAEEKFDLVYLDGLHTFEQTLRDLMNALDHLEPNGVVVIDDTRPPSYPASLPDRTSCQRLRRDSGSTEAAWMGDVYKLVWFVDTFCPHLSYRTIANNHGQTVFWRHRRPEVTQRDMGDIAGLTFEQLVLGEETLRLGRFGEIRDQLRRDLGL